METPKNGGTGATPPQEGGTTTDLTRLVGQMTDEEKQQLLNLLKTLVKKPRQRKQPQDIPENIKQLVEEYQRLKERIREIKGRLKELGYTPTGITVRRGYGDYDYRGTPAYNAVKEIMQTNVYVTREKLEEELKNRGYKGITGTIGVVLKNLREDGLIEPAPGGAYRWRESATST